MNRIPPRRRVSKTITADRDSKKELMNLMMEKVDIDLDNWELNYDVGKKHIFKYEKDNYALEITESPSEDLNYKLHENGDTINIKSSCTCSLAGNLLLALVIPSLFLLIPVWGFIPMIGFQILFSWFGTHIFLKNRKVFRLLKKEFRFRKRQELRQRIADIDVVEDVEEFPIERVA